ncbi:MAG: RDD family protein [Myxococcota bacterium]|jgi:uncharacterized RDD family membrane protein YckC
MSDDQVTQTPDQARQICSFWSRVLAFTLDILILGVVGQILGLVFYGVFSSLGGYGRIIGFAIALCYFGIMNSSICGGQTIGKRILKIKVISAGGRPIGVGRSIIRFLIIGIPYFLNGAPIPVEILQSTGGIIISVAIFGAGFSIIYMYVFNRSTRQSLHDVVVGSFVCKAEAKQVGQIKGIWAGHYAVIAVFFIAAGLLPVAVNHFAGEEPFKEMLAIQKALSRQPGVKYATVTAGRASMAFLGKGAKATTYLTSKIFLSSKAADDDQVANTLASVVLDTYPEVVAKDKMTIVLSSGYDIGIASTWITKTFSFSPEQWRERIQRP